MTRCSSATSGLRQSDSAHLVELAPSLLDLFRISRARIPALDTGFRVAHAVLPRPRVPDAADRQPEAARAAPRAPAVEGRLHRRHHRTGETHQRLTSRPTLRSPSIPSAGRLPIRRQRGLCRPARTRRPCSPSTCSPEPGTTAGQRARDAVACALSVGPSGSGPNRNAGLYHGDARRSVRASAFEAA